MDPQSQQQYGHELPPAVRPGNMIPLTPNSQASAAMPEMMAQPTAPVQAMQAPALTPPPITLPINPLHPAPHPSTGATGPIVAPAVANDLDLIEKEWVEKAKAIVAKTRTDPHAQNDQMNHFKADYMKKRYGKDIKIEQ